jgi:hypothetical protein
MKVTASSAGNLLAGFFPFPLLFSYPGKSLKLNYLVSIILKPSSSAIY